MLLNEKKVKRRRRPRTVAAVFNIQIDLGLYTLDEHGEPVHERDTLAWGRWFETAKRHVGDDTVGPYRVSTVFLGIDHGFGAKGEPVLWETMIFGLPEGRRFRKDSHHERYRTKADALAGHARAIQYAQSLPQACMNVVSGPPGEDGCLYLPSDERLAADLVAIQSTAKFIADNAREIQQKKGCCGKGYWVRKDGAIEFCFTKHRSDKWLLKTVQITLNKLGFPNAHHEGGAPHLCRKKCPNKQGYAHALVKVRAIELQDG